MLDKSICLINGLSSSITSSLDVANNSSNGLSVSNILSSGSDTPNNCLFSSLNFIKATINTNRITNIMAKNTIKKSPLTKVSIKLSIFI